MKSAIVATKEPQISPVLPILQFYSLSNKAFVLRVMEMTKVSYLYIIYYIAINNIASMYVSFFMYVLYHQVLFLNICLLFMCVFM